VARALAVVVVLVCIVFGWHLYGVAGARREAESLRSKHVGTRTDEPIVVNPVTDVVTIPLGAAGDEASADNPFDALGAALGNILGGALAKALEPTIERELNLRARESYDLYAILLPYRVRIVTPEEHPSSGD